jgi:hypothetical protein
MGIFAVSMTLMDVCDRRHREDRSFNPRSMVRNYRKPSSI